MTTAPVHAAAPDAAAPDAGAEAPAAAVNMLVLRLGGTGSASAAQSYIDALMAVAAKVNAWPAANGKYFTSTKLAQGWIKSNDPHFGIMSLAAYLGMRTSHGLSLLGTVDAAAAGGQQYFVISVDEHQLEGCKGQSLATTFAKQGRFVDNVVGGDVFSLSDFTVVDTRRPVKTIKAVLSGDARCALIDDAQMAALGKLDGADKLHTVWFSKSFPSLIVTRFPAAGDDEAKTFAGNLNKMCTGEGAKACGAAGIESLAATKADTLDDLVARHDG